MSVPDRWPPVDHNTWPPHPAMEVSYTDPEGQRWSHVPWGGWRRQPAFFVVTPRRHWYRLLLARRRATLTSRRSQGRASEGLP